MKYILKHKRNGIVFIHRAKERLEDSYILRRKNVTYLISEQAILKHQRGSKEVDLTTEHFNRFWIEDKLNVPLSRITLLSP